MELGSWEFSKDIASMIKCGLCALITYEFVVLSEVKLRDRPLISGLSGALFCILYILP